MIAQNATACAGAELDAGARYFAYLGVESPPRPLIQPSAPRSHEIDRKSKDAPAHDVTTAVMSSAMGTFSNLRRFDAKCDARVRRTTRVLSRPAITAAAILRQQCWRRSGGSRRPACSSSVCSLQHLVLATGRLLRTEGLAFAGDERVARGTHITVRPVEEPFKRERPDAFEVEARRCIEHPPGVGVGIGEDNHLREEYSG